MIRRSLAMAFGLALAAMPAAGQSPPACDQDRVGAVACLAGRLCACGYARGGIVSGRPDGYRWDCGILRPACGAPEATLPAQPSPPFGLLLPLEPGMTPWPRQ